MSEEAFSVMEVLSLAGCCIGVLWFIYVFSNFLAKMTDHDKIWLKKSMAATFSGAIGILLLAGVWIVLPLAFLGAGYEMVKFKAPKDRVAKVKIFALIECVILISAEILQVLYKKEYPVACALMWVFCVFTFIVYAVLVKVYCHRYRNNLYMAVDPHKTQNKIAHEYVHPCQGQCENPKIILDKSPTPKYHHNCRAACGSATRSGRYYRGKQRKYSW